MSESAIKPLDIEEYAERVLGIYNILKSVPRDENNCLLLTSEFANLIADTMFIGMYPNFKIDKVN